MEIKKTFELVYKTGGPVYNIPSVSKSTLSAYAVSNQDKRHLIDMVETYTRIKNHPGKDIVSKDMKNIQVVNFSLYPLPGFVTTKGLSVINLDVLPQRLITDYNNVDIYALYLYVSIFRRFLKKTNFSKDNAISISNMIFSIFMKMFGKSSGLVGSYSHLIPKLRFLITLYVYVAFFGENQSDRLISKIASSLYMDLSGIDLNYDFSSIKEFLKAVNKNNVIPISENTFSSKVINQIGVASLPMFEDLSRFYATILASTVPGNSVFSGYLSKVNTNLFNKLVYTGLKV